MRNQTPVLLLLLLSVFGCQPTIEKQQAAIPDVIDFNFHVRPILSDRCYKCHGPDENSRKGNLRLDVEQGAFALVDSSENRYAIVPGDLNHSHLIDRITNTSPDYMMPPPDSKLTLSDREVEILKRWIEQGAEWKPHWAFIPPQQPAVPELTNSDWAKNPIDQFVLQRQNQEGLKPNQEASKEKLIRRLSFDLRGIPPSISEIDEYLADDTPEAYEKLVDTFLSDPNYGERLALEWLDVARYADSHGYQDDLERTMWPWRDWVIQAFNRNLPYDQFVTWQLAGDLLPNADYEKVLATGFNRNHKITQEGGVVEEEYRVEYVLDRVNTFGTSFLGLTVSCAQCHDHKFDPISQKEYYRLFSFFNNIPERGRVDYGMKIADPSIPIPDSTVNKYTAYVKQLTQEQKLRVEEYQQLEWKAWSGETLAYDPDPSATIQAPSGLIAYYPFDYLENSKAREETGLAAPASTINGVVSRQGRFSGGLDFNGENYLELEALRGLDYTGSFSIGFWFYSVENGARGTILTPHSTRKGHRAAFELNASDDGLQFAINQHTAPGSRGGGIYVKTSHILPGNQWAHFVLTYDGSNRASGVKMFMNGESLELDIVKDQLTQNPAQTAPLMIGRRALKEGFRSNPQGLFRARLDELMLFNQVLSAEEVKRLARFDPIHQLQQVPKPTEHQQKRLYHHYLHHQDPVYQQLTRWQSEYKYREMKTQHLVLKPTMVMQELDTLRPAFILDRGLYSAPTERVYPGTPEYVMPFPEDLPKNRLGLAQWLFDEDNPLTARVTVNRYWQMVFGRGIVGTPEDFGSQGDLPSHPELLDWLAVEFSTDWDLKQLLKLMVMSATYRQSVEVPSELLTKDPSNILLARGPQSRLPAELIRDHALTVSGLISKQVGGPSVMPYQPKGLWLQVASGNQELKEYIQGHGPELYRKSMYTFWKRSLPPPSMIIFDAATREQCSVERQSTSTPMQALVLLNDPQFVEASRLIAQRMLFEGGTTDQDRIQFAFRLATSRTPSEKELSLLKQLLQDQLEVFSQEPQRAQDLLLIGEYPTEGELDMIQLAAYTVVANTIMNLSETILKG